MLFYEVYWILPLLVVLFISVEIKVIKPIVFALRIQVAVSTSASYDVFYDSLRICLRFVLNLHTFFKGILIQ